MRSFIKRIEVDKGQVKVNYKLPHRGGKQEDIEEVLPIVTFGGAEGIRTPYLITASDAFSQVNYGPMKTRL